MALLPLFFPARRLFAAWSDAGDDHDRECLDADSAGAKTNGRRVEGRSGTGPERSAPREAALEAQHLPGGAGGLSNAQQSFSGNVPLDDCISTGTRRMDRSKVFEKSVAVKACAAIPSRHFSRRENSSRR